MKDRFNKLFPCGLDFDVDFSNTALMDRYNELTKEHVEYIENATLHFADMYEHIEKGIEILQRQAKQYVLGSHELRAINIRIDSKQKLIQRARG